MRAFRPKKALDIPDNLPRTAVAVLASGGMQSAILIAHLLDAFEVVYPIYVRLGSPTERAEEQQLRRFLASIRGPKLGRLTVLENIPGGQAEDRNAVLVERAAQWCDENGIGMLALATLEKFGVSDVRSGIPGVKPVRVLTPFASISRATVLDLGIDLPLEFTFSCSRPVVKGLTAKHCGQCIKCQMRKTGLAALRINDRTSYASIDKVILSAS